MHDFDRLLQVPDRSFFLFGPRGVGKSYWLRRKLHDAIAFDLLDTSVQLAFARDPHQLEARIGRAKANAWVWIDEVQKVPALLDEVHRLMESRGLRFALSGSSARKLLRQGADLLAGRAITRHMAPLSSAELRDAFHLQAALEWGTLPLVVGHAADAADILTSYVHTYIREEIREEGLVRRIEPFLRFIEVAGLLNGQIINMGAIGRDAQVERKTVAAYFEILEQTLVGYRLPAWQPQLKVREVTHPRFYWFDVGVARGAAGLLYDPVDAIWRGRALETLIFHELRVYNHVAKRERRVSYYRTGAGAEIDFVVEVARGTSARKPSVVLLETKLGKRWDRRSEAALREVMASGKVNVVGAYGVYTGEHPLSFDGIDVLPVADFLAKLHAGEVF